MDLNASIASSDRGLNYGDGFFTTMLVKQGSIALWPLHWQRIEQSCQRLRIPLPQRSRLEQVLNDQAQALDASQAVLKLVITRGSGGRGYSIAGASTPRWIITHSCYPSHYLDWQQHGIRLGLAQQRLASGNALANLKTLNRLEQVMLKIEADESDYDDLVVCDLFANVVEGVASNLFFRKDNIVYTSDLDGAGVAGVQRQACITLLKQSSYQVCCTRFDSAALTTADEIFLSNALMQVVPVKLYLKRMLTDFSTTQWLLKKFNNA